MPLLRIPGLIDAHVHLREPGSTHKEDFYTGSRAALAGGFTFVLDMPNNAVPILTEKLLEEKITLAREKALCDVRFYFGTNAKNIEEFEHFLEGLDMYMRDNMEIGLAFKPSDDLSVVSRLSHKVDFLHCMGSDKIGFQGETFSEKALENIKFLLWQFSD